MRHKIVHNGKTINYQLKRSNRVKRMRIAVYCGGAVLITAPSNLAESTIHEFVRLKVEWILQKTGLHSEIKNPDLRENSKRHYLNHKKQALHLVRKKVVYWNKKYGFNYNEIRVKDHKTKWGSCSGKRNLNFNYKIVFLPEKLQDYIIVHELCHLQEMNHSKSFWKLVEKEIPDYKIRKKQFFIL